MHPKLKWKFANYQIQSDLYTSGQKLYLCFKQSHYFDINSTVRNDFSNLFVVMYEIVNKKGENKKCNNRVAWSVQQLREREENKMGHKTF